MQFHSLGNSTQDNLHAQASYFTSKATAKGKKSVSVLWNKGVSPHLRVWYTILFRKGQSMHRTNWHQIELSGKNKTVKTIRGSKEKVIEKKGHWNIFLAAGWTHLIPKTPSSYLKGTLNICQLFFLLKAWIRAAYAGEPSIFAEWCNCIFLMQVRRHY